MENNLRGLLDQIHTELERHGEVDEAEREKLRRLMSDIQERLDRPAEERPDEGGDSFQDRLKEAEMNFEESHPVMAAAIRQTIHLLNSMGI